MKKIVVLVFMILAIASLLGFAFRLVFGKKPVHRDQGLNILLITLDTTRSDRLGCYGYGSGETPRLDRLAASGVRFTHAYCQVPLTFPSHCSILTGTLPLFHRVRNNGIYYLDPQMETLAEVLKGRGFNTAAFVSSFSVDSRSGLDQGFDLYDDTFTANQTFKPLNAERRAEQVYTAFSAWLEKNGSSQFFCWVHLFDPHFPYDPLPPFRERFAANPYDGEIAYMDYYTGKILDKLEEMNLLKRTAVIAAGDHGEAFGEKGETGHGLFIYEPTMRVPLIFHAPGHLPRGKVVTDRVRLIDVMPTILDLLGSKKSGQAQGESLLPSMAGKAHRDLDAYIETFYPRENYGWSELTGIISGGWKYIRSPKEELYALEKDAGEEHNLAATDSRITTRLRVRLLQLIKSSTSSFTGARRRLSAEEEQKLRTLGYISPFVEAKTTAGPLPDAKDKIGEFQLLHRAEMFEMEGKLAEAVRIYESMASRAPATHTYYINYALVLAEMKRFAEAAALLRQGLAKIPDSEILNERLGLLLLAAGKWPEALKAMESTLKLNPANFNALLTSAWILDQAGEAKKALDLYDRALAIEPENSFLRKNRARVLADLGMISAAIAACQELIRDFPGDYESYQNLGIIFGMAADLEKSVEYLEKAVRLHPTPLAYFNLAVAMKKKGRYPEAAKNLRLYLENSAGEDEEKIRSARRELQDLENSIK